MNLKKKIIDMFALIPKGVQTKYLKLFLLAEDFFPFATGVNDTSWVERRISPQIFEKFENDPNGILKGLGETDL